MRFLAAIRRSGEHENERELKEKHMSDMFAAPAPPGEGIPWKDFNGCLLLIEPKEVHTDFKTSYGVAERVVRADVAVLDGPQAGTPINDTLIFPKVLVSQTAPQIGKRVLGRLGQGEAKPGQSPPWMLSEATPQDMELGARWVNRQAEQQVAQPAQPQQAAQQPAQAGQGGQQVPF
jgi:hypothetical protein